MNKSLGISQKDLETIISYIKQFTEIEKVIIFGSRSKGTYKKGSDIDLAISGTNISFDTTASLKELLNNDENNFIPYFFDIINYNNCDEHIKFEIDKYGQILFLS